MHTWAMEDNVGDIVGENCLGCCLLASPPIGRVRGLSGTRRRGEVPTDAGTIGAKEGSEGRPGEVGAG